MALTMLWMNDNFSSIVTVIAFTPHDTKNTCPLRTQKQGVIIQMRPTTSLYYVYSTKPSNAYDLNKKGLYKVMSAKRTVPKWI